MTWVLHVSVQFLNNVFSLIEILPISVFNSFNISSGHSKPSSNCYSKRKNIFSQSILRFVPRRYSTWEERSYHQLQNSSHKFELRILRGLQILKSHVTPLFLGCSASDSSVIIRNNGFGKQAEWNFQMFKGLMLLVILCLIFIRRYDEDYTPQKNLTHS